MTLITVNEQEFQIHTQATGQVRFKVGARRGEQARYTLVEVHNPATGGTYTVQFADRLVPQCSCPHFQRRLKGTRTPCKHVTAAARFLREESAAAIVQQIEAVR